MMLGSLVRQVDRIEPPFFGHQLQFGPKSTPAGVRPGNVVWARLLGKKTNMFSILEMGSGTEVAASPEGS